MHTSAHCVCHGGLKGSGLTQGKQSLIHGYFHFLFFLSIKEWFLIILWHKCAFLQDPCPHRCYSNSLYFPVAGPVQGRWHNKYQVTGWGFVMHLRKELISGIIKVSYINIAWKTDWKSLKKSLICYLLQTLLSRKRKTCLRLLPFLVNLDCIIVITAL